MNTVKRFKKTFAVTLSVMIVIVASTSVIFADDTINNGVTPTPPIESRVLEDDDVVFCAEIGDPEDFPLEETELANNMTLPEGIIVVGDDVNGNQRPTSVWNVAKKGKYNMSGTCGYTTLYSNYKFKGKTSYTIYIKNNGSSTIKVKAKRLTKTYGTTSIGAGKSGRITFSSIKKATEFYVTFNGYGNSFEGYIK